MKLLLDTHLLLWAAEGSKRMPAGARTLIANRDNLISQARVEGIMLLTNDKILGKYGRPVRLA